MYRADPEIAGGRNDSTRGVLREACDYEREKY